MTKKIEQIVLSDRDRDTFLEHINNPPEPNSNLKALFSSKKDDWETPDDFFAAMERLFGPFNVDPAANYTNAKCELYYGKDQYGADCDGLTMVWKQENLPETKVWLNPPYGRGITGKWVEKAYNESLKGVKTVLLLPARTDTKWYRICHEKASEIYFVQGRLKFKGAKDSAPFPSMVIVFDRNISLPARRISLMNSKGEVIGI